MTDRQRDAKIARISEDVALIKQALIGNGTKGLNDRVTDLENDRKAKPAKAMARLGVEVAVVGLVFKGFDLLGRWRGWW